MSDQSIMSRLFHKPGFLLARIDQIATMLYTADQPGTTLAQVEFLLVLATHGAMPQIALARAAGVDKSTTGLVLDNLEARDLVVRSPCASDRRRAVVSITEPGQSVVEADGVAFRALQQALLQPVAADAGVRLIRMLQGLGASQPSPSPRWEPSGVLQDAPSFLCRRALQHLQAAFTEASPQLRTTLRHFSLLYILTQRETITQIGFARLYGLDPSTCGVIIRTLAKRGWLSSSRSDQDGRERIYRLTPAGREMETVLRERADRSEKTALRSIPAGDVRWLVGQLNLIVAAHSGRLRFPGAAPGLPDRA